MTGYKRLFIDYGRCIGCENCASVCRFLRNADGMYMVRTKEGLTAPIYCRHCKKPACIKACPYGSLTKDPLGAVIQNKLICAGCETIDCFAACPFGAIFCTGKAVPVTKCDLCVRRRADGLEPACAEMCPTGAIRLVRHEDVADLRSEESIAARKRLVCHINPSPERRAGI
ncbi:MAG: 4Fe-4S dicluster domain-containing protein [Oceanidesulfovibrio sp.]